MHANELMINVVSEEGKQVFDGIIKKYADVNAVVSACTEFAMVIDRLEVHKPVVDPMQLQCVGAVEFATTE